MKSPAQLAEKLARQWENADTREQRLTKQSDWPLRIPIGKPAAKLVETAPATVRAHIEQWKAVSTGHIEWTPVNYRAVGQTINLPTAWCLERPADWVRASASKSVLTEYKRLNHLCSETPAIDHPLWIRKRYLWLSKPDHELIQASKLANALGPGCADGLPLRALPYANVDSKFYERHRQLIIQLLDSRHDGAASALGLENFLAAAHGNDHWLLIADLDRQLLPFQRMRARASELATLLDMPGTHLLVVENEQVLHLLPPAKGLIVILGSGRNLNWLGADWVQQKQVAYWGDIDTWGLSMLADARHKVPNLHALLMDAATFQAARTHAVPEPSPAECPSANLSSEETALFRKLQLSSTGRLEQEFLPTNHVHAAILDWMSMP